MASRFVVFESECADYTIDGYGFKYIELTPDEESKIRGEVLAYKIRKVEIERYDHDDYGIYEEVSELIEYEINDIKSLSEKLWLEKEGACDIIVENGAFFGVVCFTGFTDYRGLIEYAFIPIEHINSRDVLTKYTSSDISILVCDGKSLNEATRRTTEEYSPSGRATTSYKTTYSLVKK